MHAAPGRFFLALLSVALFSVALWSADESKTIRAGAAAIDITPPADMYPVIVNGMFESRTTDKAVDTLHARSIVLDDGTARIAIVVVDSCMMPRTLLDDAKELASKATGIPTDRMLVSATHTHSAPAAMGCLGTDADPKYPAFLTRKIAEAIEAAAKNLAPARIGWTTAQAPEFTNCRRWVYRPDKMLTDPFSTRNVRANMHPGYMSGNVTGPAGPADPEIGILSIQTKDGKPLALLANYSMHYFGSPMLSADYFGKFAEITGKLLNAEPGFVGIMSQGTSGDSWWGDYSQPQRKFTIDFYAEKMARITQEAVEKIKYHDWVPIVMRESRLTLNFRVPDEQRLAWAQKIVADLAGKPPKGYAQVYAREQIFLHERPTAELKLQALRIGELGVTAIPNEVYAITGLKLKSQSPLTPTFNIELANGAEGYIPPPEQHKLGGYTTWPARTAGLEPTAEPKITEAVLKLLEEVSGKERRKPAEPNGAYARTSLDTKPFAYWRFGESSGPQASDASSNNQGARYEDGVAFYLPGPATAAFSEDSVNRCVQFAGGRVSADLKGLGENYSVELWFWNGMPANARTYSGFLFSRGVNGADSGEHLGIGGTSPENSGGKLFFASGGNAPKFLVGKTAVPLRTWNHVVLLREGKKASVYLNGNSTPEFSGELDAGNSAGTNQIFLGGRNDNQFNFEGKIDEVSIFSRPLTPDDILKHYAASGMAAAQAPAAEVPPTAKRTLDSPPLSPEESMKKIHIKTGFEVELIAAEPLVNDPVAFDWGADGRLWIIELADYPLGMDGKMKPGGRIRVLEDTDGDGKYDKSTVFMDIINFPNGILTWRNGVIVTAAPDIFYAEDTDGDGKADTKVVLYTGFKEGNLQLRVNGLRWGLDNWVYCANGWSGGVARTMASIKNGPFSEAEIKKFDLSGRDLRIRPDHGLLDLQNGVSQYGRNRDDWGDWFGVDNSHPLFQFPFPDQYARRNSHVAPPDGKVQLIVPANPKVYAVRAPEKRYHSFDQSGRFTSACSAMIYRDELLFPAEKNTEHMFVCEPFHNLIHHEMLSEDGVLFSPRRPDDEKESEFFASEDRWSRPVMVREGPDGALWIADMYRYMIEHPDWLPKEGKEELLPFYREGENMGRIFRVYPKDKRPRMPQRLDKMNTEQLVAALDTPNGWQRDKVQQMLLWSGDNAAVPALEKLAQTSVNPLARLHALCTLDGLNQLKPELISRALQDAHPGVRRNAIRLAESRANDTPALIDTALKLVSDTDAKVKLQLACTLGEWADPRAGHALAQLALENYKDRYIVGAVMSSAPRHCDAIVNAVAAAKGEAADAVTPSLLGLALALDRRDAIGRLLSASINPRDGAFTAEQMQTFGKFLEMIARKKIPLSNMAGGEDELAKQLRHASDIFAAARKLASDQLQQPAARAKAIALIGREESQYKSDVQLLAEFLTPKTAGEVQQASIRTLAALGDPEVPGLLTKGWATHSPSTRLMIIDELMNREPWIIDILNRVERGQISASDFDAARRGRLLKHSKEDIKARAAKVFASTLDPDRQKVIDAYRPALTTQGDPKKGAAVFERVCSTCHKIDGIGHEIGPNLRSLTDRSGETLLTSIMDPNRSVEPQYVAYLCTLNDGVQIYGLITSESAGNITMKLQDDTTRNILRSDIKNLRSMKISLMPEGLEASVSKEDLPHLLEFLRGGK